jgi:hypothetical protein
MTTKPSGFMGILSIKDMALSLSLSLSLQLSKPRTSSFIGDSEQFVINRVTPKQKRKICLISNPLSPLNSLSPHWGSLDSSMFNLLILCFCRSWIFLFFLVLSGLAWNLQALSKISELPEKLKPTQNPYGLIYSDKILNSRKLNMRERENEEKWCKGGERIRTCNVNLKKAKGYFWQFANFHLFFRILISVPAEAEMRSFK